jgi:hypothetical protein
MQFSVVVARTVRPDETSPKLDFWMKFVQKQLLTRHVSRQIEGEDAIGCPTDFRFLYNWLDHAELE